MNNGRMSSPETPQQLTGGTFETGPPVSRTVSGGRTTGSVPENSYVDFDFKASPEALEQKLEEQEGELWRSAIAHSIGRTALEVNSEADNSSTGEENKARGSGSSQKGEPVTQTGESGGGDKPPETPKTGREYEGEEGDGASWWKEELWNEPKKAVWHGPIEDIEVTVLGSYGKDPSGEEYLKIDGMGSPAKAKDIEFINTEIGQTAPSNENDNQAGITQEITLDMKLKAADAGIPLESVRLALSHGYETPVETLVSARGYPPLREIFERMGFVLESQPESTREHEIKRQQANSVYGSDPYMAQLEQGIKSREMVVKLDAAIRSDPYSVRKDLKRPGAAGLRRIPLVGTPAARYVLAWQIYGAEKKRRQEVKDLYAELKAREDELKGIGEDELTPDQKLELEILASSLPGLQKRAEMRYHDGYMGMDKRRLYSAKIKAHDQEVIVAKSKLGPLEAKKYQSDEVPSRRHVLAEQILRLKKQSSAFDKRLLNPEDSYDSNEFRDEVKKARGERYPGATALRDKLQRLPSEPKS